jgi:hypothetical protein
MSWCWMLSIEYFKECCLSVALLTMEVPEEIIKDDKYDSDDRDLSEVGIRDWQKMPSQLDRGYAYKMHVASLKL